MVTRRNGGVDVVFRVPSWSERARADALAERIAALEAQLDANNALPRGSSPAR